MDESRSIVAGGVGSERKEDSPKPFLDFSACHNRMEGPEEEPEKSRAESLWQTPEGLLAVASALLLAANVLLIVAVFLNFLGVRVGWDAGKTVWAALTADLVGVAILASVFFLTATRVEGRARFYRRIEASLLVAWIGITAFWRFALPAAIGTDLQDLFVTLIASQGTLPGWVSRSAPVVVELLYLWIVCAALFLAAHVVILLDSRAASADDWARGLPVYAWVVAAGVSLVATILIVLSLAAVLEGAPIAVNVGAWLIAKMIVAPNLFISGYASSLQLGRSAARARASDDAV